MKKTQLVNIMIGQLGKCRRAYGITLKGYTHEKLIDLYAQSIMDEMERDRVSPDAFTKTFKECSDVS